MGRAFQVLLAAQPTRGVDVGAIEFIHARLREARDAGQGGAARLGRSRRDPRAVRPNRRDVRRRSSPTVLPRADASEEVLGPYMTGATGEYAA